MADQVARPSVTPYLAIRGAEEAIAFYQRAFGARETLRLTDVDGKVSHAELYIGNSPLFVSDEYPEIEVFSAQSLGGSPVMIVLEMPDVDAMLSQAVAAGASVERPLQDSFEGRLSTCKVNDPFGHRWMILSRRENG